MSASFVADGDETNSRISIAEWWLEPNAVAPHTPNPHSHAEDHLFYVIEGEVSVLLEKKWRTGRSGTYVYIPGGTEHTFENRTSSRSGFVSITIPGGFEAEMPGIVRWFEEKAQAR
jgi:quercetin dioxygenase-like cupin family protein